MSEGRDAELLPWPEDLRQFMHKTYGYTLGVIPKGTYPKYQTADVPTIIMATTLMVSKDLDVDTVYNITKALCENTDKLPAIDASMKVFNCKTAVKNRPVPVHPGALKYYKEMGYL